MAEKRLKVVSANTNFFGRVASTIRNMLVPTKLGMNTFLINIKRTAFIKAYKALSKAKEGYNQTKREESEKIFKDTYNEYLEAIDKYIMDSIYTKASSGKATRIEKKALSDYYKITTYKQEQYDEYKYRKQIFLLTLDYEIQIEKNKKIDPKFEELYTEKQTLVYRNLLKNYSIRLVDNTSKSSGVKNDIFLSIFKTLNDYVKTILPLEIKNSRTSKYNSILPQYETYKSYVGKLDEKDNLEKKMLLLSMSRTLFTHSLPLGIVEKCYEKLIKDTRVLLLRNINTKKETKVFGMIKLIVEEYNNKILVGKIYWEDKEEKKEVQKFWNSYKLALTEEEKDILLCLEEIRVLKKEQEAEAKNKEMIRFYIKKLKKMGVKFFFGYSTKYHNCKFTRFIQTNV